MANDIIKLTDAAIDRINHLVSISDKPVEGIRVGGLKRRLFRSYL